jgi:DNA-directed RNA polymerase subunit RPC12/RpoP
VSTANCPSCGAPITFAIGSSAVVVCPYCSTLAARSDRGVEDHGKVAALVDTGSPLRVGAAGKYRNQGFRITGRVQLRHQAGGTWDEWYAAFDDGRWGWLAEAQGRFYITFRVAAEAPPADAIELGATLLDGLTVAEIGRGQFLSAEGELPWDPEPQAWYAYADLTGPEGRFATIDYSEEPPAVFKGVEAGLRELGIEPAGGARAARVRVEKLACQQCGAPLELRAPDQTERIYCPSCGAGYDVDAGRLAWIGALKGKQRVEPVIAIGSRGTFDGTEFVVAGFMQRAVKFDILYYWTEYLLFAPAVGFRWLVHSDDHWSFVTPLRPGEVNDPARADVGKSVEWKGRTFRLFQDAIAKVTWVSGEFYWKVEVGESVLTADYIAPPEGLSKEVTTQDAQEIAWSHARYLEPRDVEKAFGLKRLPRPAAVGPMQPNPAPRVAGVWAILVAVLLAVAMIVAIAKPRRILLSTEIDAAALPQTDGAPENGRVYVSPPFEVSGRDNIRIAGQAGVTNDWIYLGGDLVNDQTGALASFELPIEYYEGVDQGERWSEGSRSRSVYVSRPEKGQYLVRAEIQWKPGGTPAPIRLEIREGVFRGLYLILAFLALSIYPLIALLRRFSFEAQRWKDSAHSPYGQWSTSDDEDDE